MSDQMTDQMTEPSDGGSDTPLSGMVGGALPAWRKSDRRNQDATRGKRRTQSVNDAREAVGKRKRTLQA
eukprot:3335018-Pyramimonas_sp.AAC.1